MRFGYLISPKCFLVSHVGVQAQGIGPTYAAFPGSWNRNGACLPTCLPVLETEHHPGHRMGLLSCPFVCPQAASFWQLRCMAKQEKCNACVLSFCDKVPGYCLPAQKHYCAQSLLPSTPLPCPDSQNKLCSCSHMCCI